jgi:hypothetical protein
LRVLGAAVALSCSDVAEFDIRAAHFAINSPGVELGDKRAARKHQGELLPMASVSRRAFIQSAAALGIAVPNLRALNVLAVTPDRSVTPALTTAPQRPLPDIQFAINDYIPPARNLDGVTVRFPPVYTSFTTFTLTRPPTLADQAALAHALDVVEQIYPFRPSGVFTTIGYGLPYFDRLPAVSPERWYPASCHDWSTPRCASHSKKPSRAQPTLGAADPGPPNRPSTSQFGSSPTI